MILYKYLSAHRVDILREKEIRFTEPALFNDPFESVANITSFGPDSDVLPAILKRFEDIDEEEWERVRREDRIDLSLSEFKEYVRQNPDKALEEFRKTEPSALNDQSRKLYELINNAIGVLSLSEKYDSLLMWAHYADQHRGFVLGFDSSSDFFSPIREVGDPICVLEKVKYTKNRPSIKLSQANSQDLFLHKSEEWVYEAEWRYLRYLVEADSTRMEEGKEISLFKVPPSCFAQLILGCRMTAAAKEGFKELLRADASLTHVGVYQTSLDRREYMLRFEKIAL